MMATLTVRQLDQEIVDALRIRAGHAGRSVEAEVRAILSETCLGHGNPDWASGLRDRAKARAAGQPQTDSAALVREARDGRG